MTADAGTDLVRASFAAKPLLDALVATAHDGTQRRVHLGAEADDAPLSTLEIAVCRNGDGLLTLEVLHALNEGEPLRALARRMAGETDTGTLLDILCAAAAEQCGANGAAVLKTMGNQGELVTAIGALAPARRQRFGLPGSLAREVLRTRDVIAIEDFGASSRPLAQIMPNLRVGPLVLAPLIAHEVILGVIAVTRDPGARPFTPFEARRLRAIADYAALAFWKAELLEQAQSADRAKSRFLATVSHELRTPLTALAGYQELLADQVIGPLSESQIDVLERMRSVTQHLSSVIEEVLAFSSLDEGRETVRPTDFLAADLVRATGAIIETMARQKDLAFYLSVPDRPIRMTSDVEKIRQILVNLAGNAVKFTEHGEVRLELRQRGGEVSFTVRDTGIGIAAADMDRLFKPFAQLDTSLTRRHGGTGLGLYISRGLATLLGGRIEVESEPGMGSAFTLVVAAD